MVFKIARYHSHSQDRNISQEEDNFKSLLIELTPEDLKELDIAFPPPSRKIILKGW